MEENKTKVWVVKDITVKYSKVQPTCDGDEYPYYATKTTTHRVFVSTDLSSDMLAAQKAVKEITENVIIETIKLTLDMQSISDEGEMIFSKEMTQQAVESLSTALPQYEFTVAEKYTDVKYEIRDNGGIKPGADVVAGRLKVMGYILLAFIISAIIPYGSFPWASYIVGSVYSMFFACIIYCLLTWIVARVVKADKIAVSIGVIPRICLYRFKNAEIFCGPIPFPDISLPASVVSKYYKCWTIGTIPPIILSLIGYLLVYYRNYLFETSPEAVASILQCHIYSIAALVALSCFLTSAVALLLFLEKAKDLYPHRAFSFYFIEFFIAVCGIMTIYKNGNDILRFIGI